MQHSIMIRDTGVKVTDILAMIAKGFSYYQILLSDPRLNLSDIMVTAKLAQELIEGFVVAENQIEVSGSIQIIASGGRIKNLTALRKEYPRAFEKWTEDEEQELVQMFNDGKDMVAIAKVLQRKRGAIISRLKKIGLIESSNKQHRL